MDDDEEVAIPIQNYVLRRCIGRGSFSSVWLADASVDGVTAAVKVVPKKTIDSPELFTRFKREVALLEQSNHPFIAHFYELIEDQRCYYLCMEYADNGDFESFLKARGNMLPENMCRYFLTEMVLALDYLHNTCRIAHRDLKPENILLDRYNNIRISDFGLSNTFSDLNPTLTSNCGSPAYASPELAQGQPYTKAADIWSLGVILYQMATGNLPFQAPDIQGILSKIVSAEPYYPPILDAQLIDLLKQMLCKNPRERISAAEIKLHPWICPAFVEKVQVSIDELRGATEAKASIQRDSSALLKARSDLVFDLDAIMTESRSLLPSNVTHEPPHSLPSPMIEALQSNYVPLSNSAPTTNDGEERVTLIDTNETKQVTLSKRRRIPVSPVPSSVKSRESLISRTASHSTKRLKSSASTTRLQTQKRLPIRVPSLQL